MRIASTGCHDDSPVPTAYRRSRLKLVGVPEAIASTNPATRPDFNKPLLATPAKPPLECPLPLSG